MKIYIQVIYFVLFFSFPFCVISQNYSDLKLRLNNENQREKIETYLDISDLPISLDSALVYLDKALQVSKKIEFDSIYPIQFAISRAYFMKGDYNIAKKEIRKGLNNYKFTKNSDGTLGHINMLLGVFSEAISQIDSSKYYYDIVISKLKNNSSPKAVEVLSKTYTNYANIYLKSGDFKKAIEIYFNAVIMSESVGDKSNQLITLNNIATCFKELKKYNNAFEYYKKSLQLSIEINDLKNEGAINIGIGEIYYLKNDFENALSHLLIAKNLLETTEFKSALHQSYESLSKIYLKKNEIKKAYFYSEKAIKGIESVKEEFVKAEILLTYAKIEFKNKNYIEALKRVNEALFISRNNNYLDSEKKSILLKIEILKQQNKLNLLAPLYDKLLLLKDTILSIENLKSINELETKYETEKKELENLQLKVRTDQNKLEIEKEGKQKWFFAVLALFAILTVIAVVFYSKNRRQKLLYNAQLNIAKTKQMEHQRIATDLHDYKVKTLEGIKIELDKEGKKILANKVESIKESLRSLSKELSRVSFEESELDKQIITLMASYSTEKFSISHKGLSSIKWKKINAIIKQNLFLVIREGISNAYNHAEATNLNLVFYKNKNQLQISITDNGKGYENKTPGIGFANMKMRINEINGKIKIESKKGTGTKVGIHLVLI